MFIPALESELIDSSRCGFYLEKLEGLFRSEAYAAHLDFRLKEEHERQEKKRLGAGQDELEDEYMG